MADNGSKAGGRKSDEEIRARASAEIKARTSSDIEEAIGESRLKEIIDAFHKRDADMVLRMSRNFTFEERLECARLMAQVNSFMETNVNGGRTWTFSRNEIRMVAGLGPLIGLGGIFGLPEDEAMKRWAKGDFVKMVRAAGESEDEDSVEESSAE